MTYIKIIKKYLIYLKNLANYATIINYKFKSLNYIIIKLLFGANNSLIIMFLIKILSN